MENTLIDAFGVRPWDSEKKKHYTESCFIYEAEDRIYELSDEIAFDCTEDVLVCNEDEFKIYAGSSLVKMPELGLIACFGTAYTLYEDGEWEPDFSVTLLYDYSAYYGCELEDFAEDFLYWEQDGLSSTLFTFLRHEGLSASYHGECIIDIPLLAGTYDEISLLQYQHSGAAVCYA